MIILMFLKIDIQINYMRSLFIDEFQTRLNSFELGGSFLTRKKIKEVRIAFFLVHRFVLSFKKKLIFFLIAKFLNV